MGDELRWGILGTGKIARIFAGAIAGSTAGRLVAVASRDADRARAFAYDFSVDRSFPTYEGLIADPDVEIAYVATDHPSHLAAAVGAAEAGKHVLCEKPLAMNVDEAGRIVEAARRNGVFLMEAFAYRCHPQTRRLIEVLGSGRIGEIKLVDAVFGYDAGPRPATYVLDHDRGGGSILDVGCYTTSMCHLVAGVAAGGLTVESIDVSGVADIGTTTGVDHSAAATISFPGGMLARVASSVQADLESSLRIYGSDGRLTVPSPWFPGRIGPAGTILVEGRDGSTEEVAIEVDTDPYAIEVRSVSNSVRAGERSPAVMTWEASLANMRTLDRWRASVGLRYGSDDPAREVSPAGAPSGEGR